MSNYTFTFKKGDIIAEFTTTDKEAVERQFPIWVESADKAAKAKPSRPVRSEEKNPVKPAVVEKPVEKVEERVEAKVEEKPYVEPEVVAEPQVEQPVHAEADAQENAEVFDKASDLLKTINSVQNPPQPEPAAKEKPVDFDKVLEASLEHPTFEPNQTRDERFLDLVASKNTTDRFHYLIITAYYLLEFEKKERFSLKQINAKLMNNLSRVVDHTILREAINQNFIEIVPDLTGTSETAEYRLTAQGEDFFFNRI